MDYKFQSIWLAKRRHFFMRSLWMYLVVSLFFTISFTFKRDYKFLSLETLGMFLLIVTVVLALAIGVNILSACLITGKLKNRQWKVIFSESEILVTILEAGKELTREKHFWNEVTKVENTSHDIFLILKRHLRYYLVIKKEKLTKEEKASLKQWLD